MKRTNTKTKKQEAGSELPKLVWYGDPKTKSWRCGLVFKERGNEVSLLTFGPTKVARIPKDKLEEAQCKTSLKKVIKKIEELVREENGDLKHASKNVKRALKEAKSNLN